MYIATYVHMQLNISHLIHVETFMYHTLAIYYSQPSVYQQQLELPVLISVTIASQNFTAFMLEISTKWE